MDNFPLQQAAPDIEQYAPEEYQPEDFAVDMTDQGLVEMPDGSVMVMLDGEQQSGGDFYENLAAVVSKSELSSLALQYIYNIESDKEARKQRDEQYEEGLRRTGMGDDAPGGAAFAGAARVTHPVMAEACVDFAARGMKELFPPDGPVRINIKGENTEDKIEIAERKRDFMNWQLTEQIVEFRDEIEQLLTQLPLGGSQFLKMWWDAKKRRPCAEFVPIDRILLPFSATNFYCAQRTTEMQDISDFEYRSRIKRGLYLDGSYSAASLAPDATLSESANQKIEGKEYQGTDDTERLRRMYHVSCNLSLEDDQITGGEEAPYMLMIDDQDYSIVGLYRNWEDGDETLERLDWMVEFKFIPWRGAYAIGLPQLIGGLAASATGALRALLDTAHINNTATMLKLKGAKVSGQSKSVEVTQIVEIEGAVGVDDIRKIAMPMPFNPPSPVLFELLGWITNAAKGVVTIAEEKIADITSNAPVGTTQALIEQGSVVFSSIHAKLHDSQRRVLKILQRIDKYYLIDQKQQDMVEEFGVTEEDFASSSDVIPVSDPHIFSEGQRVAQNQMILQLMKEAPDLYDPRAVHGRIMKQMRVPNVAEIMPQFNKNIEMHAADENAAMAIGRAVVAYPEQDHLAHLETLFSFAMNPALGSNPIMAPVFVPAAIEHAKQHMLLWYTQRVEEYAAHETGELKPKYDKKKGLREIDHAIAGAAHAVNNDIEQGFQQFSAALQQLTQIAQQYAPQPQQDPILQASLAETQRRKEKDMADITMDGKKLELSHQQATEKNELTAAMATEQNLTKERISTIELSVEAAKLKGEQEKTVVGLQDRIQQSMNGEA